MSSVGSPKEQDDTSLAAIVRVNRRTIGLRFAFSALYALIASSALPPAAPLAWLGLLVLWELVIRDRIAALIVAADQRSRAQARAILAIANIVGGSLYNAVPVAAMVSGTSSGYLLGVTWICGTFIHAFVYYAEDRWALAAGLTPSLAMGGAALVYLHGLSLEFAMAALLMLSVLASATVFAADKRRLLRRLSDETAAREAAEASDAIKAQFLGMMSHELRTPLNAIIGYAELIEEDVAEGRTEAVLRDLRKLRSQGLHLLDLVGTLLERSSAVDSDRPAVREAPVDVAGLARDVAMSFGAAMRSKGLGFRVKLDSDLGVVLTDGERLRHCLNHLLANALTYTAAGSVSLHGRWSVRRGVDVLELSVSDTGRGIAAEELARLFAPLGQGGDRDNARLQGAGLGLALTRRNARALGGDVEVESAQGRGSTFTLWIPCAARSRSPGGWAREGVPDRIEVGRGE
ncbi:MAG: HAMP domain-containing histidine kinase [Hyphomonadaceae bacterium]|nr:HAMP domain-containing histidine kinase [Hyphomonadaceae bacterium]